MTTLPPSILALPLLFASCDVDAADIRRQVDETAQELRELGAEMHAFQMLFVRSVIGVAILAAVLSVRGWAQIRTHRLDVHLGRNLVHFAGQSLWIVGISLLPLATVAAIEFTIPIWGIFLAVLFLGEDQYGPDQDRGLEVLRVN